MRHLYHYVCAIIFFICSVVIASAQTIYVWEDSQGRKHYTQLKPDEQIHQGIVNEDERSDSYIPESQRKQRFTTKESSKAFLIDREEDIERLQAQRQSEKIAEQQKEKEDEKRRQEEAEKLAQEQKSAIEKAEQSRQENCEVARTNLQTLDQYMKGEFSELNYKQEDGSEAALTQDEIEKIHSNTLQEVDYFCK